MWDWLVDIVFMVLQFIQSFVVDWGLSIVVLTCIIRLIVTPLSLKSFRSSAKMQVIQPKLQAIQERYSDDPQRQQEELAKFYSENKFNPLGGCLPLIIQMPVFFALFSVLRYNIPEVAPDASFLNFIPRLAETPATMISQGIAVAVPYFVLLVGFGVLTLIPMLYQSRNQTGAQAQSMKMMSVIMGLVMMFVGYNIPAGVLIYYNVSALWQVLQQFFVTNKVMAKAKAEEEAKMASAPIEVDVVRRERKQRPHKKR